ncbi:protein STRUBBELIG-RECEPTOR FAMILY 3-like isoform X2 [Diospyros lotus]|uniref:protein STRUBBELIG-RECEPTOR FAMILY 3-like isoform X2 n=1 Tax=Diospyros lotus TaxID=55363 RepID=UPI0022569822|nr:protein STRUBBELIG-RECEPTOR FAMILY 3-like isoform X2 [Diospyros lotus]
MMASKKSAINCLSCAQVFTAFVFIYAARLLHGYTNPADVAAINSLYAALGYPSLPGWVPNGGDPCTESWQGVLCNNTDISSIILIDANLGGELGDCLSSFSSIKEIQLSNNNIGGSIPSNLPVTLETLSLDDNQLTGKIPDVFQGLIGLFNLDLSSNNLSGQLPPSMENLSSLTTLHLQNNQLSGTLNDLQDLALKDLNIENNLFNGPIPDKLLSIPNFKKDGNPFNSTTIAALPPPSSTTPPPAPPFPWPPWGEADGPCEESKAKRCKKTTNRVVWIATAGVVLSLVILVLAISLFMSGN